MVFLFFLLGSWRVTLGVPPRCALASSKLLKKPDQCRGITGCSHLFWSAVTVESEGERADAKQVLQCLQRALKVANGCMETNVQVALYIEVLNHYIVHYRRGVETVTPGYINKIIALIHENIDEVEEGADSEQAKRHLENTLKHIKYLKGTPPPPLLLFVSLLLAVAQCVYFFFPRPWRGSLSAPFAHPLLPAANPDEEGPSFGDIKL